MPRGYRGKRFTPKLITTLFVTLFVTTLGLGAIVRGVLEQVEYERRSYDRSAQYTADTYGPAYDACIRLPLESQPNCVANASGEYRENERKEQDLIAQQTTAVWTFLMGLAAIVGVAMSALGVYLVWTTFRETRKSNEIARESMERQLRAYLCFESIDVDASHGDVKLTAFWKNTGQTPARKADVWLNWEDMIGDMPANFPFSKPEQQDDDGACTVSSGRTVLAFEDKKVPKDVFGACCEGTRNLYVWGRAEYTDIFGASWHDEFSAKMITVANPKRSKDVNWIMLPKHNTST
jgi:hypothetical protein